MSANRDKNQKIAFVYSNLYQLYREGKDAATAAPTAPVSSPEVPRGLTSGKVIKAREEGGPEVQEHKPPVFLRTPASIQHKLPAAAPKAAVPSNPAVEDLKNNLKTLNELHSRLRIMLEELEDLIKND